MFKFLKKEKSYKICAVVNGNSINIEEVKDTTFSQKIMGDGVAIIPNSNTIVAPCDGKITVLPESRHAFGIVSDNGIEILVHIGIDTVNLNGDGFESKVIQGSTVKQGEEIITFDREKMISEGIDTTTMIIVLNDSEFSDVSCMPEGVVNAGKDTIIEVLK